MKKISYCILMQKYVDGVKRKYKERIVGYQVDGLTAVHKDTLGSWYLDDLKTGRKLNGPGTSLRKYILDFYKEHQEEIDNARNGSNYPGYCKQFDLVSEPERKTAI